MPGDLLARRLPASGDLLGRLTVELTAEQSAAIDRRQGSLLLDAAAGSGKTSVLVERFVRSVVEDEVPLRAILAITFTEKAATELRERIRRRLREVGAGEAARAAEGAGISTIHSFCARTLRAHALRAGLDPAFAVLEAHEARELADAAFDGALAQAAREPGGAELIAAHGPATLRGAIVAIHDELRSRGQQHPSLPPLGSPERCEPSVAAALGAAREAAVELGAIPEPPVRVGQALDALGRAEAALAGGTVPWPGELAALMLPARNGAAALKSDACERYRDALESLRDASGRFHAVAARDALDALLRGYAVRYSELKAARSSLDFEDLELGARALLELDEVRDHIRKSFAYVMVDEMQDTNRVQLELIDLVAAGNLFMVGDAQQSIYGFRHADVELFEERGRELAARGARLSLRTNFRSRPAILAALNGAFATVLGDRFRALVAGRVEPEAGGPRQPGGAQPRAAGSAVELLVVDKGAEWESDGLAAPWRLAEARALAGRMKAGIEAGEWGAGDAVVLTRAATDL
ncbi:MAG TPA: UvrD-helicase domain-containing protein, partial [Solirubrobacteraceae bacterium]|nr:UvrD-helicase domain-containing protein [Solirubrobacteraceae bacterium]